MFKILLEKLKRFYKEDKKEDKVDYSPINGQDVFIGDLNRYTSSKGILYMVLSNIELLDNTENHISKFIYINEYHFSNINNIGEFLDKIKDRHKVIFTAKFNLLAENKNYYNNREYFSDVKIIDCGY